REKLFIVVRNLLANAFKFRDPARKNSIAVDFMLDHDGSLTISVTDTGIGIHPEDQEKIFDEFFQVEGDGRRRYEGTGLGLSIVQRYTEIMGGQIRLISEPGKGSRFILCLPSSSAAVGDHIKPENPNMRHALEKGLIYSRKEKCCQDDQPALNPGDRHRDDLSVLLQTNKIKVLVVDDHAYNCEVMRDILEASGYEVEIALGGEAGLDKMKDFVPDLILLDMMMPGFSGEDFIKFIKNDDKFAKIPVIFVTARSSDEDVISGLKMGADDYLTKPIISEELMLRVSNILSRIMYIRTQSERETIIKNIGLIQEIHKSFGSLSKQIPKVRLAECYRAAEEIGGDWRSVFYDEKNQMLEIFIGDVAGHGISSAIYTVAAAGAIKNAISMLGDMPDKQSPIDRVRIIARHLKSAMLETSIKLEKFMTMAMISINLESGNSAILNAGHRSCLLGGGETCRVLNASGDPIGIDSAREFECIEFEFLPGDILFMYTDGLMENRRENGKNLRLHSLKQILAGGGQDVERIKKDMLETLTDLWGDGAIEDDYTFLVVQRV
ncbi:MAG: SpoIIE family protein phosphatase, partial [Oligoflexales bacterium]|nr:SpoIIE family protein phosphatase [Oligoflexales bacterium]